MSEKYERDGNSLHHSLLECLGEVLLLLLGVGDDGVVLLGGPAARDDAAGLVCILEGLDQAHGLLHRATHWKIVDRDVANDALVRDDEHPTERDAGVLDQNAEVAGHLVVRVGEEVALARPDAALVLALEAPGVVAVDGVRRADDDLRVALLLQLLSQVREVNDLRGADEGEVERIEEDNQVLALVVRELALGELKLRGDDVDLEVGAGCAGDGDGHFNFYRVL